MPNPSQSTNWLDDNDDEGWQDMPVVVEDDHACGLDEEDQKKYHYVRKQGTSSYGNATGNLLDFDDTGTEWRSRADAAVAHENEYTRVRVNEENQDADGVDLCTRYLFDEDAAMTPLAQMQTTKRILTEAQRIAYVGLCALAAREMVHRHQASSVRELRAAAQSMDLWRMKIMGRLYYHMELDTAEQKMIDGLDMHGVRAVDLAPALMTTHTVANPGYNPAQANNVQLRVDEQNGPHPSEETFSGVTTTLSTTDKDVTLDIRWTVLCDLFLILIADSVYDARSRVLLENVACKLGLNGIDVAKFERRVTEALEIQEGVEKTENQEIIDGASKAARKRRYVMMGLATLGGGLVIGLSAGLLAPVIGAGLGAALTTIGISGTSGFLAGAGGAAVITTGGVLTGSGIAARGMARRTRQVRTFDVLPLHNNKRVSCVLTVPGFMNGKLDDVRLPFSVLDPIVGDVFSVLWEPEMIMETGSALKILTTEILSQIGQTVLQHTVMTALMGALQWPIVLTKLGYLIDNPWNNTLDRARAAGSVLAQLLIQRHLGVRPITLIGFSLGARVIFYGLLELAKAKAFGIVQDVFLLGGTLTASERTWCEARSVVSGRFVNGYARNDWVLNYLFRATSAGLSAVAGLRPVNNVPGLENVDVTDKIAGHMSYRTFMPLILEQLGFPVTALTFDEPTEPDFTEERVVVREEEPQTRKKRWFLRKTEDAARRSSETHPPVQTTKDAPLEDDQPERISEKDVSDRASGDQQEVQSNEEDMPDLASEDGRSAQTSSHGSAQGAKKDIPRQYEEECELATATDHDKEWEEGSGGGGGGGGDAAVHAGFDLNAIRQVIGATQEEESVAASEGSWGRREWTMMASIPVSNPWNE